MLSIKNITNSDQASSYFSKDDYYVKNDPESSVSGVWHGLGAVRLGLDGKQVELDQFKKLLKGELPDGDGT